MKFLCIFLLPAVFAAVPHRRVLFDTFLNSQEATNIIDQLVGTLGTDDNEAKCEQECHVLIRNEQSVFQHLCPFLCHSAQNALQHLHSPNTDPTSTGKRLVLDSFLNTQETSNIIDQLVATLGSDETEVQCEKECHVLIRDSTSIFQHMCPFLCHSAQAIVGNVHHHTTTAGPVKRVLFDTFLNSQEATNIIDQLVATLGTDDNEAKCEQECHVLIRSQDSVFQHLCPFLCHSAQNALQHLHSPTSTGKRLVLDSFLNTQETSNIIDQLVATLGSDETEVQCEKECHVLIRDSTSIFQHMCPFLCHSAQAIVGNVHHHTTTAGPVKRVLFDTFLNSQEATNIIDQLVGTLGTDDNEAKCEQECHVLIRNEQSVFQHLCPFLCHSAQNALQHLHSPNTDPTSTGKRLVLDSFLNTQETSNIIDQLVATLSSDETEVQCEKECHVLIRDSTSVFQHMCPFLCHSAQAIVGNVHHHTTTAGPVKRVLLDTFLNTQETSSIIDQLVNTLSSDETEAACEKECHVLIRDSTSLFQHMCPFLCHSAQAIFNGVHHTTPATVQKRFLVDTLLANPEVSVLVSSLVSVLGSDPTEKACENECVVMMHADNVIHHLCPFICNSFQQLVSKVHIAEPVSNPSKRFLVDSLLNNPEVSVIVDSLVGTLGSDPTEAACESQCTNVVHVDNVFHYLCPLICTSFQSLVQKIPHHTQVAANPGQ
ncbi:uncharacterized protein LOC125665983 [Ostrea edulis]|uniref:uncharacterized protein LOC125665983 n=1 Tax=Ostrea edulis TaxID=37623 RepID=UPI002095967D|nr:uncharacterized protein LOC125665983 [Ostrea edulis]XP_056007201.1 uncharacterized protein LOC125665983 [Ostrea edulis]